MAVPVNQPDPAWVRAMVAQFPGLTPEAAADWLHRENGTSAQGNPAANNPLGLMYSAAYTFGIPSGSDSVGHATFPDMQAAVAAYYKYLDEGAKAGIPGYRGIWSAIGSGSAQKQIDAINASAWPGLGGYKPPMPGASWVDAQWPWLSQIQAGTSPTKPGGSLAGDVGQGAADAGGAVVKAGADAAGGILGDVGGSIAGAIAANRGVVIAAACVLAAFLIVYRTIGLPGPARVAEAAA